MKEINTILAYENSPKIVQDKEMFNFSIDSTVLSFFVEVKKKCDKIIDLGTGNGSIPLFLSLFTNKPIYGVEIQEYSCELANESIKLNNLESQITIINDDIKGIHKKLGQNKFGLVVSNPPYFKLKHEDFINDKDSLSIARHEVKITMEEIIKEGYYLLKDGGSFSMVQSSDRFTETITLLNKYHLSVKRIRFVYPMKGRDSYVFLIDARKNGKDDGCKIMEPLYIYEKENEYSKEILEYFHYGENNEEN